MAGFFKAVRWTGTGGGQVSINLGFQPDMVWVRLDALGGSSGRGFLPGLTAARFQLGDQNGLWVATTPGNDQLLATPTGFTGDGAYFNGLGTNYIAFCFRSVSLITSLCTWLGNGANRNVPHGLGATPEMIYMQWYPTTNAGASFTTLQSVPLIKSFGTVNIQDFGIAGNNRLTTANNAGFFNSVAPNGTNISIGTGGFNTNPWNYWAYSFVSKAGFCKIGTYNGDGNANGSPIDVGFVPTAIVFNRADTVANGTVPAHFAAVMTNAAGNVSPWTKYFIMPDTQAWSTDPNGVIISGNTFAPPLSYNTAGTSFSYMAFGEGDVSPPSGRVSSSIIRTF